MRDGGCTGNSFCSSAGVMNRRGAWGARQPTGAKRHCNACVLLSTFSASTSNFAAIFWWPGRALPPNSAAPVFQAARGYEAYRINTPAQVLSGARSGVGGAIRVRTICMGWPQLGQRNGARGLTQGACATITTMSAPIRPTRNAPKRRLPARQRTGSSSVAPLTQKCASVIVIASIEERPRAHDDAPCALAIR